LGSGLPIAEPVWSVDGHRLELLDWTPKMIFLDGEPLATFPYACFKEPVQVGPRRIEFHSRWDKAWRVVFVELFADGEMLPPAHTFYPRQRVVDRACDNHSQRNAALQCAGCQRPLCGECLSVDGIRCLACLRAAQERAPFVVSRQPPPIFLQTLAPFVGVGLAALSFVADRITDEQALVMIIASLVAGFLAAKPYEKWIAHWLSRAKSLVAARPRRTLARWLPLGVAACLAGGAMGYEEWATTAQHPVQRPRGQSRPPAGPARP
jgi:hypothetical protein